MKANYVISGMHTLLVLLCGAVLALHRGMTAPVWKELLLVAVAALLVVSLAGLGVALLRTRLRLKPAQPGKLVFALVTAAGILFLVSAVFAFLMAGGQLLSTITAIFAAVCGVATLARLRDRDEGEFAAVCSLVPIFFICFYLLMFYRDNGDNPHLSQFGYEVAVIVAALLGLYGAAAGRFEAEKPALRPVLCGVGLLFIVQQMGYLVLSPDALQYLSPALAVTLTACGLLIVSGLCSPPMRAVFPPPKPAEEEKPEDAPAEAAPADQET